MPDSIRILIAEDQDLLRSSFRLLIDSEPGLTTVGDARTGREAVELTAALSPHIVLMDIRMPEMDGLAATQAICASTSSTRVIMLTTFDLDEYIYGALRAGASGFLLKNSSPEDLLHAIHVVASGEALLAPQITSKLIADVARDGRIARAAPCELPELTPRELDVVSLVARGRSNAEIAAELYLSGATVKSYISRLLTKLDVRDRAQLVILAYECGIVEPSRRSPR